MDSKDLYFALLGLKQPWAVEDVAMDVAKQEIVVTVVHPPRRAFAARSASASCRYSIMPRSAAGATSTATGS